MTASIRSCFVGVPIPTAFRQQFNSLVKSLMDRDSAIIEVANEGKGDFKTLIAPDAEMGRMLDELRLLMEDGYQYM
jgi:hypothetical protein